MPTLFALSACMALHSDLHRCVVVATIVLVVTTIAIVLAIVAIAVSNSSKKYVVVYK